MKWYWFSRNLDFHNYESEALQLWLKSIIKIFPSCFVEFFGCWVPSAQLLLRTFDLSYTWPVGETLLSGQSQFIAGIVTIGNSCKFPQKVAWNIGHLAVLKPKQKFASQVDTLPPIWILPFLPSSRSLVYTCRLGANFPLHDPWTLSAVLFLKLTLGYLVSPLWGEKLSIIDLIGLFMISPFLPSVVIIY